MQVEDMLLGEGHITKEQYEEALEIKKKNPNKTVCKILVELNYLDIGTYTDVMGRMLKEEGYSTTIDEILLKNGLINQEQLEYAIELQKKSPEKKIWRILIEEGFITYKNFSDMIHKGTRKEIK